ncbi:31717_t:CDS:2, partial [Gigaspora margarita]
RDKWEDRVVYIRDKICKSHLNQITLLEYYYFLGEHLEERRVYELYKVRGVHNILTVQHTTANTLNKLSVDDYSLLLSEAHKVREEELNMFLDLFTPFAEA